MPQAQARRTRQTGRSVRVRHVSRTAAMPPTPKVRRQCDGEGPAVRDPQPLSIRGSYSYPMIVIHRRVTVSDENVTLRYQEAIHLPPGACPQPPAGEALATQTALPPQAPLRPLASLAPPAKFGRPAQDDPRAGVLDERLSGQPVMVHAGCRPRALAVLLDDPAATALSLRTHMEPADLMELILILAQAAADALRERDTEKAVR